MNESENPDECTEWRNIAKQIQQETDPQKMIELVRQMLAKFDEEKLRKSSPPSQKAQNRSNSSNIKFGD